MSVSDEDLAKAIVALKDTAVRITSRTGVSKYYLPSPEYKALQGALSVIGSEDLSVLRRPTIGTSPPTLTAPVWSTIPNSTNKTAGFTLDLAPYLDTRGHSLTIVLVGSVTGWSLVGTVLTCSGVGSGSLTARVTYLGVNYDSNSFSVDSVSAAVDSSAPTIPVGLRNTGTSSAPIVSWFPSADPSPSGAAWSGRKDYQVYDGVSSIGSPITSTAGFQWMPTALTIGAALTGVTTTQTNADFALACTGGTCFGTADRFPGMGATVPLGSSTFSRFTWKIPASWSASWPYAKIFGMLRTDLTPGAINIKVVQFPYNQGQGAKVEGRLSVNGTSFDGTVVATPTGPLWFGFEVTNGTTVQPIYSTDSLTFTAMGSPVTVALGSNPYFLVGIASDDGVSSVSTQVQQVGVSIDDTQPSYTPSVTPGQTLNINIKSRDNTGTPNVSAASQILVLSIPNVTTGNVLGLGSYTIGGSQDNLNSSRYIQCAAHERLSIMSYQNSWEQRYGQTMQSVWAAIRAKNPGWNGVPYIDMTRAQTDGIDTMVRSWAFHAPYGTGWAVLLDDGNLKEWVDGFGTTRVANIAATALDGTGRTFQRWLAQYCYNGFVSGNLTAGYPLATMGLSANSLCSFVYGDDVFAAPWLAPGVWTVGNIGAAAAIVAGQKLVATEWRSLVGSTGGFYVNLSNWFQNMDSTGRAGYAGSMDGGLAEHIGSVSMNFSGAGNWVDRVQNYVTPALRSNATGRITYDHEVNPIADSTELQSRRYNLCRCVTTTNWDYGPRIDPTVTYIPMDQQQIRMSYYNPNIQTATGEPNPYTANYVGLAAYGALVNNSPSTSAYQNNVWMRETAYAYFLCGAPEMGGPQTVTLPVRTKRLSCWDDSFFDGSIVEAGVPFTVNPNDGDIRIKW